MSLDTPPPLILTLMLDQVTFIHFDRLRKQHFPPQRNFLPAHVTVFHALPGDREESLRHLLQDTVGRTLPLALSFPRVRFLGRGVAVDIECRELINMREELAAAWADSLRPQDRQKYRPHVTIQNKVAAGQARDLYHLLSAEWRGRAGVGEGLLLWRYLGGPWEMAGEYRFTGESGL